MIQVNIKTCTQCGICALNCPVKAIEFKAGTYPKPVVRAENICLKCGQCVVVCPPGSLTNSEVALKDCPPINTDLEITPEQYEQMLRSRRSIRVFKKKPVSKEKIKQLIEIARYAPTGGNRQEVEWLVICDQKILGRIEEIGTEWAKLVLRDKPELAAILNIDRLLERQVKNHDEFLRGAPALVIAHASKDSSTGMINCVGALTYLNLAAESHVLGCCWAGFIYTMGHEYAPMQEVLNLPKDRTQFGCMMLGYPKFKYYRLPARREPMIAWR